MRVFHRVLRVASRSVEDFDSATLVADRNTRRGRIDARQWRIQHERRRCTRDDTFGL